MRARSESGFTLLEIMMTVTLVAIAIIPLLLIRERSVIKSYQAHNANLARMHAREILSEVEFRGIDQGSGQIDGFPGFSYNVEIQEVDLVTGEDDEDEDSAFSDNNSSSSKYEPQDQTWADDEEDEEKIYPVRRVTLTLWYPNLDPEAGEESLELMIEAIFPPLPEDDSEFMGVNNQ